MAAQPTIGTTGVVAVLHEHPTWATPLLDRLVERGIEVLAVDVGRSRPPGPPPAGVDRWLNRINAMPSAGRGPSVVAAAGHLLLGLELRGELVVNGHRAWAVGASKAAQLDVFDRVGLATPPSVAVVDPGAIPAAAADIGFPLLVKPNVGGSGQGIVRFDGPDELAAAVAADRLELGVDGTGVVQRVVEPADGLVHRVEMLGPELFYATDQVADPDRFNYCAADGCAVDRIAIVEPDPEIVAAAAAVMEASGADVAGVEYLVDVETGRPCFFDLNPYSNFLSGRDGELGFDPIDRYLDAALAVGR